LNDPLGRGKTRPGGPHFKEPFLHKYMVCIRTCGSQRRFPEETFVGDPWNGLLLNLVTSALKPLDEGPPPTCPFIKPTMRKSKPLNRQLSFLSVSGSGG
jgi:hypothetical protein